MTDTPLNKEIFAALDASIKAWEEKRDAVDPFAISMGHIYCPLCELMMGDNEGECDNCPVALAGFDECEGTPWGKASDARKSWQHAHRTLFGLGHRNKSVVLELWRWKTEWQKAAQNEIDFLKSLRPAAE